MPRAAHEVCDERQLRLRLAHGMLLERDSELDVLSKALASAREGIGSIVMIEGAAGIGKSRLLDVACQRARLADDSLYGLPRSRRRDPYWCRGHYGRDGPGPGRQVRQHVTGHIAPTGHLVAEEDPAYLTARLLTFLSGDHATSGVHNVVATH